MEEAIKIISIVTPSYNQGKFIQETIQTVLSQKGDFYIDYIIMDGGSTDDTVSIIKKHEKLLRKNYTVRKLNGLEFYVPGRSSEPRIVSCRGVSFRWFSERDRGQSHALNKGIQMIRGSILPG